MSAAAHTTARSLAREYHVVLNPEFQAVLVNVGLRKRGWYGHWARDIGARLKELKPRTLVLHWGVAYDHTSSEGSRLIRRVQPKSILVRRGASGRAQAEGSFGRPRPGRYYVGNSYFIGFYCNDLDKSSLYYSYLPYAPRLSDFLYNSSSSARAPTHTRCYIIRRSKSDNYTEFTLTPLILGMAIAQ